MADGNFFSKETTFRVACEGQKLLMCNLPKRNCVLVLVSVLLKKAE